MMTNWQEVWARLQQGQHTVVQSTGILPAPDPWQLRLLVVDCEAFSAPRGALDEACRLLRPYRRALTPALLAEATSRLRGGLRQRLLGESEAASELARYQQALSGVDSEPKLALFLRGVDQADAVSLALLQRLIHAPGAPLPLLLGFDTREPRGPARELLEQLTRILPREAFCWPAAATEEQAAAAQPRPSWQHLAPPSLRVLRAGATVGDRFESSVLAQLLGMDELDVLAALQEAADAGVPLEDRGHGVFRLGGAEAEALRQHTLPSLARAWHERLAQLLGGLPAPVSQSLAEAALSAPAAESLEPRATGAAASGAAGAAAPAPAPAQRSGAAVPAEPIRADAEQLLEVNRQGAADWGDPRPELWWENLEQQLAQSPPRSERAEPSLAEGAFGQAPAVTHAAAPSAVSHAAAHSAVTHAAAPSAAIPSAVSSAALPPAVTSAALSSAALPAAAAASGAFGSDERRAAQHAEAAGRWYEASARHLAAAEEQSLSGFPERALAHAQRASILAASVSDDEQRRRLRITALLLEGRSRWECPTSSPETSLPAALNALLECRELLRETDPPGLSAELGRLIAGVQYDIGTPAALEHALRELTAASQLLLAAGQPLEAACLLNDEAAVWVKLGDPVRAHHLLSRSREVFGKVLASYPAAQIELAETEHLLARLLLQAPARPGRERDALQLGLEHGRAAAEAYESLKQPRAVARVQETLARIEMRLGRAPEAAQLLAQAREAQLQLGDDVGRARSSAAAAELHAAERNYDQALERLQESIALNAAKGLRAGLLFNLASLQRLEPQLPSGLRVAGRALQARLVQTLEQ